MNRFSPRFLGPIDPLMAPPIGNVPFRPPQGGGALRMGGGGMSAETMGPGHSQQQGGNNMGAGIAAGGLLAGMGGPTATSVMDPGFVSQAANWAKPAMDGAWPELAKSAAGGGGGLLGSLGGVAGGMTGADLGPMADLGLEAAGSGGNALALSNPATAALAAPGILNMAGLNVPNPVSWLTGLLGF